MSDSLGEDGSFPRAAVIPEANQLISEWTEFHRALQKENGALISTKVLKKISFFYELFETMCNQMLPVEFFFYCLYSGPDLTGSSSSLNSNHGERNCFLNENDEEKDQKLIVK